MRFAFVSAIIAAVFGLSSIEAAVQQKGHAFDYGGEAQPYYPKGHPKYRAMTPAAAGPTWSYNPIDTVNYPPQNWYQYQPVCGGSAQSPIDIDTWTAQYDATLGPLVFNFNVLANNTVVNNGHAIQVSVNDNEAVNSISGGGLAAGNTYYFAQFHFHTVSEHTLDGGLSSAELHLVFINPNYAYPDPRQIAVIGVLFNIGEENAALNPITDLLAAGQLQTEGESAYVVGFDPNQFVPANSKYYTYSGSLTTPSSGSASSSIPDVPSADTSYPGCAETVTWHVLAEPQEISLVQFAYLHNALSSEQAPYTLTNRPVQPLNGRVVRTNIAPTTGTTTTTSSGSTTTTGSGSGSSTTVNVNFANLFNGLTLN